MRKIIAIFLLAVSAGLLMELTSLGKRPPKARDRRTATLSETYIAVDAGAPVDVPPLVTTDGGVLSSERLQRHWSVIFFGFTACPLVCPQTLSVLSAVARNPESGVSSGIMQPMFVSVDPERDTPARMDGYLKHFDHHILGLTGTREAIDRFSREIGAGSLSVGSGIDHSTSLFVLDPRGHVAGILLRPSDPASVVADLATLRNSYAARSVAAAR